MEYQEIFEKLKESPVLLIGIGRELQVDEKKVGAAPNSIEYAKKLCWMLSENRTAIEPYFNAYQIIKRLTEEKDYFIVTTNTDNMLEHMGFDENRIVSPCGSVFRMQCEEASHGVWDIEEALLADSSITCPVCQGQGRLNIIASKPYNEVGYQKQWEIYTRWLQRTINRKIVLLELGEGFETPTVIRWPFEKIAFINQKSTFVRVNRILPQMEVRERAYSVKEDSISFVGRISELLN